MNREERVLRELEAMEARLNVSSRNAAEANFRRLEGLIGLYGVLDIGIPLPSMVGYAMSPETVGALVTEILTGRPATVVELGSGVSTLLAAYAVRNVGAGRIISLEHDAEYYEKTRQYLLDHNVSQFVHLHHCPLRRVDLDEGEWQWYGVANADLPSGIDLLVVDGPPASVQTLSRYPAMPLLYRLLSPAATVLVDDAVRDDENKMIQLWTKAYTDFQLEGIPSVRGAVLLRRCQIVGDRGSVES